MVQSVLTVRVLCSVLGKQDTELPECVQRMAGSCAGCDGEPLRERDGAARRRGAQGKLHCICALRERRLW